MLKLIKSNLLILAMVFAMGTAVIAQTSSASKAMKKWALDNSDPLNPVWLDVTGQNQETPTQPGAYRCNFNDVITCTAEYDELDNPNDPGPHTASNRIFGEYEPVD